MLAEANFVVKLRELDFLTRQDLLGVHLVWLQGGERRPLKVRPVTMRRRQAAEPLLPPQDSEQKALSEHILRGGSLLADGFYPPARCAAALLRGAVWPALMFRAVRAATPATTRACLPRGCAPTPRRSSLSSAWRVRHTRARMSSLAVASLPVAQAAHPAARRHSWTPRYCCCTPARPPARLPARRTLPLTDRSRCGQMDERRGFVNRLETRMRALPYDVQARSSAPKSGTRTAPAPPDE